MEKITLTLNEGRNSEWNNIRKISFIGEELGEATGDDGNPVTIYKKEDNSYLVLIEDYNQFQGGYYADEYCKYSTIEALDKAFPMLSHFAGYVKEV